MIGHNSETCIVQERTKMIDGHKEAQHYFYSRCNFSWPYESLYIVDNMIIELFVIDLGDNKSYRNIAKVSEHDIRLVEVRISQYWIGCQGIAQRPEREVLFLIPGEG